MAKTCSHTECNLPVWSKGLCQRHWKMEYGKPIKKSPITNSKEPLRNVVRKLALLLPDNPSLLLSKPIPKVEFYRKRTPISPISDKRKKQLKAYKILADQYKKDHHTCGVCGNENGTEIHHQQGRENELLLDTTKWILLCDSCHRKATDDSKGAIESGISISRHKVS